MTWKFDVIFCCGRGNVPTANNKCIYTKLWTENDSEEASKYR